MPDNRRILIAAGGTGGHLFPAEALAGALIRRGATAALISDKRVEKWIDRFPGEVHMITAGTVTGATLGAKLSGLWNLYKGYREASAILAAEKPACVVGFGGYPTVPPLFAAARRGIPTLIHEGNAVMGRANRFLAPRVSRIATGFPLRDDAFPGKTIVTGNPVRVPVIQAAGTGFPALTEDGQLRLIVFGGSQGARVMSDVVPNAIEHLPEALRKRIHITQQARDEDMIRVTRQYERIGVSHVVQNFFDDLPRRIAESHLVIARAGASTVSELAAIGRPAILVPLPGSLDQDQAANAEVLAAAGAAVAVNQAAFTPVSLAETIDRLAGDIQRLQRMAAAAKAAGVTDAASRLASEVLSLAGKP